MWLALVALMLVAAACTPSSSSTTTSGSAPVATTAASDTTTSTEPALVTGVGVEGDTIRLAAFYPTSGALADLGTDMLDGQRAYWAYVNDDLGGVGGRFQVVLDEVDTKYDPDVAKSELTARESAVFGVSGSLGSPVTETLLSADVPVMVGSAVAVWGTDPDAVFDLTVPTFRDQVAALVNWWEGSSDGGVGFVAPAGVYGDDCLAGMPTPPETVVRFPPGTTDFGNAVGELSGVGAVVTCVAPADLVRLVATFDLAGERPAILATSAAFDAAAWAVQESVPERLWVAGAPPEFEADTPGMTLFREVTEGLEATPWTFAGYTQAATFHLLLEQAFDDGDLTRSGVLAARSHLGDVDFGFGRAPSRFEGTLPVVEVVIGVPDPETRFGLRETATP